MYCTSRLVILFQVVLECQVWPACYTLCGFSSSKQVVFAISINNVFSLREASDLPDASIHTRTHKEDLWTENHIYRCVSRFVLQPMTAPELSIVYHVQLDETGMRAWR